MRKERLNNRFRLIIRSIIRRIKRIRKNSSRTSLFSMTISTFNSTFITTTIILISTINLNLTLFEPHPTPPSHSPQTPHSPLSSPYPLSPHSIPLVTFNFTSITFCYESKSPWPISVSISVSSLVLSPLVSSWPTPLVSSWPISLRLSSWRALRLSSWRARLVMLIRRTCEASSEASLIPILLVSLVV